MPAYHGKRTPRTSGRRTAVITVTAMLALLITAWAFLLFPRGLEDNTPAGNIVTLPDPGMVGPASSSQASASKSLPPEPPVSALPSYDFSQPAPEGEAVDNRYFDDAAFVGDSRTDGFMLYSGIGTGKNLTSNGLSIFTLPTKKALTVDGEKYTLLEALALEQYGKVYISLGVNELGTYNDTKFYNNYAAAIDQIRAVQPNAVIYIQGLIPLNEEQIAAFNGNKYNLTNEHLRVYNDLMRQVAEEKQVVYLDLYTAFADENGILPEGASRDGVHLVKESCQQWLEYLKTHTVDFDTLYPNGPPAAEITAPDTDPEDGSVQG